ncbi:EamA family transporter [Halobacteriales archaeon SW_7_68_16]|nr:MAG: EamA family transporter [Halobacteriales archaeon SW_7_68_16]
MRDRTETVLGFLVLAAVWGTAFTAIKEGLRYYPPVLFAAFRYDVAGLLMAGYAVVRLDRCWPADRREWAAVGVGAVLIIAGYHALLFAGERTTTGATAAVIVSLSPVLTAVFARLLLPEDRIGAVGAAGLLLGLAGVVSIARPDPGRIATGSVGGELLVVGAVASFALGSVLTRRLDADMGIEAFEGWAMIGGAAAMHLLSLGLGEPVVLPRANVATAWLGYLALVASAGGFLIYFALLDRVGPNAVNLVSYVAPVFAALADLVVRGTVPGPGTLAGFCLIAVAFGLLRRQTLARELAGLRSGTDRGRG